MAAAKSPNVLAMYDISINAGGQKWQPAASEPVRVDIELDEPVTVAAGTVPAVVHLADDGTVEELEASRYGFTYNKDKSAVTAFWFSANGFSVYAIIDENGDLKTPRRFYHFYGHPTTENGISSSLPYLYLDQSNDVVNVQIVKDGDILKEPPIPPDILDEEGRLVSMFEGWYVVSTNKRPATAVESKLDPTNEYFRFVWPTGVTGNRMAFTNAVAFARNGEGELVETEDTDWWIAPLYEHARFVQFNENTREEEQEGGGQRIIDRKLIAINEETGRVRVKVSDVSAALVNSRQEYFCGWRYMDQNGQWADLLVYDADGQPQDQYITIDNALFAANGGIVIPLYPIYVSAHFLNFDTNAKGSGATYVGSIFVRSTSEFGSVTPSGNRLGYNFTGWRAGTVENGKVVLGERVTDENGNVIANVTVTNAVGAVILYTDASGVIRLNKDVTLYAGWEANTSASYRVIVWQQRVTDSKDAADADKKYYYVTHYTSPAVPATTHIAESMLTSFTGTRADGTSIRSKNLETLSGIAADNAANEDFTGFHYARYSCEDETVAPDGSTVINVYYDRKLITFTFGTTTVRTGLYGQSFDWPTPPSGKMWQYRDGNQTTTMTFMDAFIPPSGDGDMTFTSANASANRTINFFKQSIDGTYPTSATDSIKAATGTFHITDKYNGFHAAKYKVGNNNEVQLGNKDSNGDYATVSGSSTTLNIYFARNSYELIYKDGDDTVYDTGKTVPYESSLAGYDYAVTNAVMDWGSRDITVGTFMGWYEDASLTVPFDFTATMPDGKKFLYAKWAPVKYKVIVDPNGGEMQSGDSTWFYLDEGEKLIEYTVTRNYRLDMHNGTYYYHHDLWDPVKDKHTDQYDPSTAGAPRRAYYTQDVADATDNEASSPENRYSYEPKAYAFMGWYEVLADGTLANDPFSFNDPPNRPLTIRALWRRTGVYTLRYESIDPDGLNPDEVICDPEEGVDGGYIDDAVTTMAKDPTNYNKNNWVWEGWQVVDTYNNYIPLTNIRSPGDVYVVHEGHADRQNVIHFRAVYKYIGDGSSRHIPPVTDLILDSNENAALAANAALPRHDGRTGLFTDGSSVSVGGFNQGVWFAGQQNNFSVDLADYSSLFAHANGYFLLGWDPLSHVDSLIPTYTAEQTVGVDKSAGGENVLYAVWEPQVYIDFVNDTGANLTDVTLYIPSWVDGELFRVNTVTGTYGREAFTSFSEGSATFDLAAGETLRLVLPDAADRDFAVLGACAYAEGEKLVVTRTEPQIEGQDAIPDVTQSVYPGENYMVSGTMKVSPTPVQVRFTKTTYQTTATVPVRYFLHLTNTTDGVIREITHDDAYWRTVGGNTRVTNITVRTADIDLAAALHVDSSTSVHGFLADLRPGDGALLREGFRCTTIGIGSATAPAADFAEYRTITKRDPSGGSYIHYRREHVEWSRYSHVWNAYDDAAVYVVFYRREPVHVTVAKSVVGTEEDKIRPFEFTADFVEKSKTFEYTVTTSYRKTRTIRSNAVRGDWYINWEWSDTWTGDDWASCAEQIVSVTDPSTPQLVSEDQFLFSSDGRESEDFTLAHGDRHPLTIYFNKLQDTDPGKTVTTGGKRDQSSISYYDSNGRERTGWYADDAGNGRYRTRTETTNWTQTVTYLVTYQYEMVTIREKDAPDNLFVLNSIDGDPDNPLVNHNGTANVADRSYTISSLRGPDASGFYDYQLLDTAIFKNERKTGSLTVSKTVVGGEEGDTFPFTVTLDETVVDKDNYTPPEGVHLGPYGKVFSFSLANGGSVTLDGLPAGAGYTVAEVAHDKYVATVPANATGTVAADATAAVGFTNTRKTDLAIAMKDLTAIFTGEEQHGHEISSVTGTGFPIDAEGYAVTGLKSGHVLTVDHYVMPRGTVVGSYTGHVENVRFTVQDANEEDVTGEYIIEMTPGALTIEPTPIVVTVTGNQETRIYNGEEQELQGYTYVITHAVTGEVLTNDNVFVSIPSDFQMAWRKDVGRSEMSLTASHVVVTVPDGMSVSETVVAANGWLEITPAAVTVKADDKVKILNRVDPPLTATVTGLFGDDSVAYTLSRAVGEAPGTYEITASGEATQGNYAVTCEPGALTIEELELIQRVNGSGVSVSVPVEDEMIDALGFDSKAELSAAAVGAAMNAYDPNGLRRWENLVTGTATTQLLLGTAATSGGSDVSFGLSYEPADVVGLGYSVSYELRKWNGSGWSRLPGVSGSDDPLFSVESDDVNGYYRVFTLIVPDTDLSITNEIPSTNTIGVLRIASTAKHTMAAVPFLDLPKDPALKAPVKVEGYVGNGFVKDGDFIRTREDGTFKVWAMESGKFEPYTSVKASGKTVEVSGAAESPLVPGRSVWVTRADHGKPFIVLGQFSGDPIEVEIGASSTDAETGKTIVGATMVTNPNMEAVKINDIDWGENPQEKDSIEIPSATGEVSKRLFWYPSKGGFGYAVVKRVGKRYVQTIVTDCEVPAGMGFWYYRASGGSFKIVVKGAEDLD